MHGILLVQGETVNVRALNYLVLVRKYIPVESKALNWLTRIPANELSCTTLQQEFDALQLNKITPLLYSDVFEQ